MGKNQIRTVFMGSPEISVPVLKAIAGEYNVVGVVTQPDREAGRGKKLSVPAVKTAAEELGIPIMQPVKLRNPESFEQLQSWQPELIVVLAFGQILRNNVLELPRFGCINVHASLLPKWRGASPIQAAILAGDAETGVTIMKMDAGIDTGPALASCRIPIAAQDTAASLSEKLGQAGADLILKTLPGYLSGEILPQAQDESGATYTHLIKKEDGLLDFNFTAAELERKVRAYNPWPSAYFMIDQNMIKVHQAHTCENAEGIPSGKRCIISGIPAITAKDGILVLDEIQAAGKKPLPGKAFLAGFRNWKES